MAKVWIPKVSRERILELAERIKPVVHFPNRGLCYIKQVDPFEDSYTLHPKDEKEVRNIKPLSDITTYHRYTKPELFRPTIEEVLAQIPAEHLDKVVAFQMCDVLFSEDAAMESGYHTAVTRLFVRE